MNWALLVLAGLVEVAWSQSIKPTENFTRPLPTLLCFVLAAAAVYLLSQAMNTLPVGTAYAVFTGIGAVGAIALGIFVNRDPVTIGRVIALSMIVGGIVLARATMPGTSASSAQQTGAAPASLHAVPGQADIGEQTRG